MSEDITKIISDGILAPSGENCQPWRFTVEGNKVYIFNIPEADQSLYNYDQKGSYVAHGALIENMVISASKFGYETKIELFPKQEPNLVAILTLEKKSIKGDQLSTYLDKRHTNRKEYSTEKLSKEQKNELISTAEATGFGSLKIIDDEKLITSISGALAVNEKIIFENKELHNFFYSHILWNEEDQYKAGGFYIKTLEFFPHQLKGVKLFKNWAILKILNKLAKVSQMIVKDNIARYEKSGALAVVMIDSNDNKSYVNAGRLAERVWLKATELGLSIHPCTGVLFLMENIKNGNQKVFINKHQEIIKKAYRDITDTFAVQNKTIPMLFRIGYGEPPTATAIRMKPTIENR
jgi:hypothetical protein